MGPLVLLGKKGLEGLTKTKIEVKKGL